MSNTEHINSVHTENAQCSEINEHATNEQRNETNPVTGLTSEEVQARVNAGEVNVDTNVHTRSIKEILFDNLVTLFNIVNLILAIIVFCTGSYKNMLFMVIILANVVIGIVQELRSKAVTDKLSIVAGAHATVIRNGERVQIDLDHIVRDDILCLGRGMQVPADCQIITGECAMNESLLTGESKLVHKSTGDMLMSGSFVNSGTTCARVVHVGAENYASKISAEAKKHKKAQSEIMDTLNKIVKYVSIALPFVGAALFCSQYFWSSTSADLVDCILSTVAALIGMIPEGLILLTSTVLAVAVVRLSKSNVLVQQLYCIETLARVDTLCLDKTGTITTGFMEVERVVCASGVEEKQVQEALAALMAADNDPNETSRALMEYCKQFKVPAALCTRAIPFSSDKKFSGGVTANASFALGAAQFVMRDAYAQVEKQVSELAQSARVLVLAEVGGFTPEGDIEGTATPLAFICIRDQIRSTAAQTIQFFKEQGVCIKVISGDDPATVANIAAKVGVEHADAYVDATTLKTDEDVAAAMQKYHVFGRVKPEQKKQFVCALQQAGHTVAMTGDGVNDTLALKQANCSVAMASGSDAARNVAHLVLVDNDFASMPKVVAEGRRSINNLQRSASLFLVKTLFSMTMAILFVILPWQYPFQPIQMTLVSAMTIGLPSFVLALEPNHDRIKGKFLENVIVRAIPGAITVVASVLVVNIIGNLFAGWNYDQISTLAVLLTAWTGIMLIIRLSIPFTPIRAALLVVCVAGVVLGATLFHNLFSISALSGGMWLTLGSMMVVIALFYHCVYTCFDRWHAKRQAKLV